MMTLEAAAAQFGTLANVLSAEARDGAIYALISHDTQLRGMPDEFEGYAVYYTHNDGET